MTLREPVLKPTPIASLRPTQITVGMREVTQKRSALSRQSADDVGEFLGRHMIPTVLGQKGRHYMVDHHHLALALHCEGVTDVLVSVIADLQSLSKTSFWTYMDNRSWCHPYDADGRRVDFDAIPSSVAKLQDDPYRSLAGELRQSGGFAKDVTPFSEFLWADFLRGQIKRSKLDDDFEKALAKALILAKSKAADYLPGWCGPKLAG